MMCTHCAGSEGAVDHVLFPQLPHHPGARHRGRPRLRLQRAGQFNEGFKCRPLFSVYSMLFRAVLDYILKVHKREKFFGSDFEFFTIL